LQVLIVDDNELNVRALQRALGNLHSVRIATSAQAALSAVRQLTPDVIVCDFELGDQTCTELLRIITAQWPRVRRVLYSASQPERWTELVDGKLIDAALAKPASTSVLVAALGE
jgi:CheY-like chemotaxis protein